MATPNQRSITVKWIHGSHSGAVLYTNITYWKTYGIGRVTKTLNDPGRIEYEIKNLAPYTEYSMIVVTCVKGKLKVLCSDASKVDAKTKIAGQCMFDLI